MSDYSKITNFLSKDSLALNDPAKYVKGSEIDAEFNAIATAISTKPDELSGTWTPSPTGFTTVSGSPVWTGTYAKSGNLVTATAAWTGGVLTSVGGTTSFFSGLAYPPDVQTAVTFVSSGATQGAVGVLYPTGDWYAPVFTAVGAGTFSATFKTT